MWAMQKRRWWKIATQHNTAMPRMEKEFPRKYIPARAIPISHLSSCALCCGKPMWRWAIAIDAVALPGENWVEDGEDDEAGLKMFRETKTQTINIQLIICWLKENDENNNFYNRKNPVIRWWWSVARCARVNP